MRAVRCKNGHYYDGDMYVVCPHCGAEREVDGERRESRSIAGFVPRKKQEERGVSQTASQSLKEEKTEPKAQAALEGAAKKEAAKSPEVQSELEKALRNSSAAEEGKTLSYFNLVSGAAASAAVAAQPGMSGQDNQSGPAASDKASPSADPAGGSSLGSASDLIVGFLISLNGPHLGEVFGIHAGLNSIGRSAGNRICLGKDFSISREKHSLLTYEPKMRRFYIERGDSSGLTYVNGEFITGAKVLQERDTIELGSSSFLFLPLCNESFSWEDYLNKG